VSLFLFRAHVTSTCMTGIDNSSLFRNQDGGKLLDWTGWNSTDWVKSNETCRCRHSRNSYLIESVLSIIKLSWRRHCLLRNATWKRDSMEVPLPSIELLSGLLGNLHIQRSTILYSEQLRDRYYAITWRALFRTAKFSHVLRILVYSKNSQIRLFWLVSFTLSFTFRSTHGKNDSEISKKFNYLLSKGCFCWSM